jgi:hypothetical protein
MKEDLDNLLLDVKVVEERGRMLRMSAEWISEEIGKILNRVTDEELEVMAWEERESYYKLLDELGGRLISSARDLVKLDEEYRGIVKRVNKAYGKEVLKLTPPLTMSDILSSGGLC